MDDFELELEVLKSLEGKPYDEAWKRWLGPSKNGAPSAPGPGPLSGVLTSGRDRLLAHAKSEDWRTAVTSQIILGWIDHGADYEKLLSMLDGENVQAAGRTAAGLSTIWNKYRAIAQRDFKENILPLCWEVILKHSTDWPAWKVTTFFRILQVTPDARSLEPLFWFLESTANDAMAHDAAKAIARLGRDVVTPRLAKAKATSARLSARMEDVGLELDDAAAPP